MAIQDSLTFLFLNGYEVEGDHDEELADKVLELLAKTLSKDGFAEHFKVRAKSIL